MGSSEPVLHLPTTNSNVGLLNTCKSTFTSTTMTPLPLALIFLVASSEGLFFGGPRISSCRSNYDCPALISRNFVCKGFLCLGGYTDSRREGGKCVNRSGFLCNVGRVFSRRRRNQMCDYKECAECLNDSHCHGTRDSCGFSYRCYDSTPPHSP